MTDYSIHACHLYGNLLNTYGDIGNLLILEYFAKKIGVSFTYEVISLDEAFEQTAYDFVLFGGGQDFEQSIVSKDIQSKKESLTNYIHNNGVFLGICGGFQLLGDYYIGANGEKISGISAIDYHTDSQKNHRFIGDIKIYNKEFDETYVGFENHNGLTYLGKGIQPLGIVQEGFGNNGEDQTEGVHFKNTFGSYFHGPILPRNVHLAKRLLKIMLEKKYQEDFSSVLELK
ncbi:type 1 glutamine amidotransferase [Vagococcus elongatus]|uniref:Lipid II isoglutaminyl synthase (glutamine-hydrolyzing) subunit GatD n=1 Tax=Vagococcus elongatus TaxID=180344 RepID=A0A430AZN7_9ENTE|nr:adenosylcobyric acid synthase [Vagococcus elongatus]RSU13557.1 adenosylcobyric acid synthase [Vagococcus elongatus]